MRDVILYIDTIYICGKKIKIRNQTILDKHRFEVVKASNYKSRDSCFSSHALFSARIFAQDVSQSTKKKKKRKKRKKTGANQTHVCTLVALSKPRELLKTS